MMARVRAQHAQRGVRVERTEESVRHPGRWMLICRIPQRYRCLAGYTEQSRNRRIL